MDTILVVDDKPDNVKLLLHFLMENGDFKVLVANDGEDGIETAKFAQPDLILLDVVMPDINGFSVCKLLKEQEKTKNIPIIFMTARTDIVDKITGFELGAADYITKPFEQKEVLARVNTHLKLYKLQQQLARQNQQLAQQNQQLVEEISYRKQAETTLVKRTDELSTVNAKLAKIVRLKDEFLANMSHELRTPLSVILNISEVLQEQFFGPLTEKQSKYLHTLKDSGHHLLALINDILDLSKIEADKLTLNMDIVIIKELCQASLRMIQEIACKKQLRISTFFAVVVETIQADERRLKQILVNLLSNAVKFTAAGGSIHLEVNGDIEQDVVTFSVQDTGIGIAKEDMKHIFDKFVQVDGTLNRQYDGTGLGLSLVYHLTEMHGGSISVESEVGKGSCFTVSLPWHSNELSSKIKQDQVVSEPESVIAKSHRSSKSILIVDNQEISLEVLSDYLIFQGYQVCIARNGIEALQQTRTLRPDLILMDIQIPMMNGLTTIQKIRADAQIATTPIIALTALTMPGDKERCLEAGANNYLSKPANMKKLIATIDDSLSS